MIECQSNATSSDVSRVSESEWESLFVTESVLTDTDRFLEGKFSGSFRVWHVILMACAIALTAMTALGCMFRFRIPRTKSEIEANHRRRHLMRNFERRLKMLRAADLDELDYRAALEKLREEFNADNASIALSEAFSIASITDDVDNDDTIDNNKNNTDTNEDNKVQTDAKLGENQV